MVKQADSTPNPTPMADLTIDELRPILVEAMLPHVPFDGWTDKAVSAAAVDLGLSPAVAALVFKSGAGAMIEALIEHQNRQMLAALDTDAFRAMKVREKVTKAVRTRLEQATPHREAIRKAAQILAMPQNAPLAARLSWQTADAIWRAAGDTSTDFNHYSKRALASLVYGSTLFYWLADESEDFADSWAFLDRRIADVMQIEKAKGKLKAMGGGEKFSVTRFLGRLRYPVQG